jgi:tRNA/tmRNA/rRNA uracil-C5-methylase (TrmA/RlmC/RlmD family)
VRAPAADELAAGVEVEVECGPVAHGGHVVARYEGRVLFVRHALPGERVVARITEGGPGDRFLRADAVSVIAASPDRVEPPCPYAGPGGCGGCDLQHVTLPAQRILKESVVREQFTRLAHLDLPDDFAVEALPGDDDGLGWRTRVELAVGPQGRPGLRVHRSHEVVPVDRCLIATGPVNDLLAGLPEAAPAGALGYDLVDPSVGEAVEVELHERGETAAPVPYVVERVTVGDWERDLEVSARGFWQVHPGAASAFVGSVLAMLDPRPGERCLDLYAGVGLFAAALGDAVGDDGSVVAVESDPVACRSAEANLADHPATVVLAARVDDAFGVPRRVRGPRRQNRGGRRPRRHPLLPPSADLVVLDPPRTGAGRDVLAAVAALRPRAMAYVACDPAALARDTAHLRDLGYALTSIRAFDAFPMTHHVECVARFEVAAA